MRIALINNFERTTGIGKYTVALFKLLNANGIDATLISLNPFDTTGLRGNVVVLNDGSKTPFNTFKNYFINPHRIAPDFDLYHITNEQIGIFAKYNKPSVVTFLDTFLTGPGSEFAAGLGSRPRFFAKKLSWSKPYHYFLNRSRLASCYADAIICDSEFTKRNVVANLPRLPREMETIFGLTSDLMPREKGVERRRLNLPMDANIILTVGGDSNLVKNLPVSLTAFSKVLKSENECFLLIVGRIGYQTKRLIADLKLETKVIILPHVTEEVLASAYNASDVLLFPVLYAGFGLPVVEAFASGCPVVASNAGSIPEIAGNAACLNDPGDVEGLANSLISVLSNKYFRETLILRGLKVVEKYSINEWAKATVRLYERVIYGKARSIGNI